MEGKTEKLLTPVGPRRRVIISACLLGEPCRWHGRRVPPSKLVKSLMADPDVELVPVCPEILGGLGVPRPPIKRRPGRAFETCAEKPRRKYVTGREVTAELRAGAEKTLDIARANGCGTAYLCHWSPSCDRTGFAGKLLTDNGINVINTW